MRSELFRILMKWGDLPIFGIGVLLALWAVVSVGLLVWHARRHGRNAEFWGYLTPIGISGAIIVLAPRFVPDGIPVRGYGVMLLAAILTGLSMAIHRARQRGVHPDTLFSLVFWLFVFGIGGARLFFVIEYWDVVFAPLSVGERVVKALMFTEGGLVVYGSLIGATVAFLGFCYRQKLPTLMMADVLAPSLAAGLALGRIGCLLNGCCYGGPCDADWAVTFPESSPPFMDQLVHGRLHGIELVEAKPGGPVQLVFDDGTTPQTIASINGYKADSLVSSARLLEMAYANSTGLTIGLKNGKRVEVPPSERQRSLPIHPTQIYSAVNAGLLAWFLWAYYPSRRRDGEVILLLLTIYPVSRFLLEMIRIDESAIFGTGLSISQNVSLVILAAAVAAWFMLPRWSHQRADFSVA